MGTVKDNTCAGLNQKSQRNRLPNGPHGCQRRGLAVACGFSSASPDAGGRTRRQLICSGEVWRGHLCVFQYVAYTSTIQQQPMNGPWTISVWTTVRLDNQTLYRNWVTVLGSNRSRWILPDDWSSCGRLVKNYRFFSSTSYILKMLISTFA